MKKLLAVFLFVLTGMAFMPVANAAICDEDEWKFEPTLGPSIGIRGYPHQFAMNFKIGKEMMGANLTMAVGSGTFMIRPAFVVDVPFYLTLAEDEDFSIGPTADVGPTFSVRGIKAVTFIDLGFGARTTYQFTDNFGVVAELIHFTMSFVGWASGAGVNGGFAMSYDMKFGVFLTF
ncbi:MAG: hypothetical protein JXA66_07895 [Oligoflexia bacterium]|nr:hypothetical protein [Oligoflexia bacterium]